MAYGGKLEPVSWARLKYFKPVYVVDLLGEKYVLDEDGALRFEAMLKEHGKLPEAIGMELSVHGYGQRPIPQSGTVCIATEDRGNEWWVFSRVPNGAYWSGHLEHCNPRRSHALKPVEAFMRRPGGEHRRIVPRLCGRWRGTRREYGCLGRLDSGEHQLCGDACAG